MNELGMTGMCRNDSNDFSSNSSGDNRYTCYSGSYLEDKGGMMSNALMRGRTLEPQAVKDAKDWRTQRLKYLLGKYRLELTRKERNEARRLTGRWDFWNYREE